MLDAPLLRLLVARLNEGQHQLNRLSLYATGHTLGKDGSFWKGRKGKGGDLKNVLPSLVQNDQVGPAMTRIVDAQLDRDPDWQALDGGVTLVATTAPLPTDADPTKIQPSEIVDYMTVWHSAAQLLEVTRTAAYAYQWAGRMIGRVYIPDVYQELIDLWSDWTLETALELVHIQAVDPRDGGPLLDAHGRVLGYYFAYSIQDPLTRTTTRYVELHTPQEVQLYQRVGSQGLNPVRDAVPNPMHNPTMRGSRRCEYLMFHQDRPGGTSLTPTAQDAQDRLNVAETYMARNDDLGSFRMLVTGNAEEPVDAHGNPTTWKHGPDIVISLLGVPKDDREKPEEGGRETPTFQVVDPLDPSLHNIPSINHWRRNVLAAFDQEWVAEGELAVSGESKRVSRKPFDKRVVFASTATGAFMSCGLRAALKLAASIVGEQQLQDVAGVRFRPRMYLDVDSTNLAEYTAKLGALKDGALDLESVLESTPGITDVSSVKARVLAERQEKEVQSVGA